ncbi:hypothetical protein JCM10207_005892 [Rhodosporidiobolus poonsookiae]
MLSATTLPFALAALASSAAAHYQPASHNLGARAHHLSHRSFFPARSALQQRKNRHARRAADPASIMPGTLTAAEGCTEFYHVESGDWCYKVVDKFDPLSLEIFYELNPQIDGECHNLWAGYDVCVSRTAKAASSSTVAEAAKLTSEAPVTTTTTTKAAPKTTTTSEKEAVTTKAAVAAPQLHAAVTTTTTQAAKKTTTSAAAPASTSAAAVEEDDEDDEDEVCDDEDEDEEDDDSSESSSAAPSSTYVAPQTTSKAAASTTTTTQAQTSSSAKSQATAVADTSSATSLLKAAGLTSFLGEMDNSIVSWYNTNSGQDSTNGNSWCGYPYSNSVPGFAPSLKAMMSTTNYDYEAAAKIYCGKEAIITLPNGKEFTAYIADAFDDTWVRTPASIDVIHDLFNEMFGSSTDNKNDVIQKATWRLTGNTNSKYTFKSTTSLT